MWPALGQSDSGLGVDSMKIHVLTVFQFCASPCEGEQSLASHMGGRGVKSTRNPFDPFEKSPGHMCGRISNRHASETKMSRESRGSLVFCVCPEQIASLCAEEAAAQEQTGQVEECLKVNLLKIKTEMCKKVTPISHHFLSLAFLCSSSS